MNTELQGPKTTELWHWTDLALNLSSAAYWLHDLWQVVYLSQT